MLGMRRSTTLKLAADAASPMVAGVVKPVVILPSDAEAWSAEHRKLVLLHELAHIKRRDVLTQTIAEITCALYWFNPIAWWGSSCMKQLREIACDDAVVTHSNTPCDYAKTLVDVAKRYRNHQPTFAVAMARNSNVESRVAAILDATRRRASLTRRSAYGVAFAALLISILVGALQLTSWADDSLANDNGAAKTKEKAPQSVDESRVMRIRVLDAKTNKPLAEASVLASIWELEGSSKRKYPNKTYATDDRGVAEVTIPRRLRILRIWPSKENYVPQFINFAEGSHEEGRRIPDEYEFKLEPGHRLSGRVVDNSGKPIVNAKVQVKVQSGGRGGSDKPQPGVSTWLATGGDAAVTDEDGRWQITNAPPHDDRNFTFRIQTAHENFAGDQMWGELQEQQGITTAQLRDGTATLVLDQGIAISGTVTDSDSKPVTKGLVIWNARPYWANGVNETQIDESGNYETLHLKPGQYPVTVVAPGFAPEQRLVDVSQTMKSVDFQLQPGNPIKLRIVDSTGAPVPNAYVSIGEWRRTEAIYNHKHPNVPESGIPRRADDQGVYSWEWAPSDAVQYQLGAKGFDTKQVTLVAKQEPHEIQLTQPVTIFGNVTDKQTGKPIPEFQAIPVKAYRPDFYSTDFQASSVAKGLNGKYELKVNSYGQTGNRYRVRIEADGYRTAFGKKSLEVGDDPLEENFRLDPVPALVGTVVNPNGSPAGSFTVAIGTATTSPHFRIDRPDTSFGQAFQVRDTDEFTLAATFEDRRIRVFNDAGFAEIFRGPNEDIGKVKLRPWATLSGQLLQNGQPIAQEWIYFHLNEKYKLTEARFQDSFTAKTDSNGNFRFDRLPPFSGHVKAFLGPWRDSPLTSSQSVPLELKPGEHTKVSLGGQGAVIVGRVVATGRSNSKLSKSWSLNFLVNRNQSVPFPKPKSLSFSPSGPLDPAWLSQPDFTDWLATRENHFVKLAADGRMRIHGVLPGKYDLVIQLYEQPAGCLVETIGEKVVSITVTESDAKKGEVEIGDIEVPCSRGPRVGTDMRAFEFVDSERRLRAINDMKGRYVLFHVWASWCKPCIESMPDLKATMEKYHPRPLTIVGLNIDNDKDTAKGLAELSEWKWAQNYLGDDSDLMKQLAISTVPAYYLIGTDGKLLGSANEWATIKDLLVAEFE